MIEKLKRPVKIGGTTFREKINELVDAVNSIVSVQEKLIDSRFVVETKHEAPADPYANQRKWIGYLCWFWDDDYDLKTVGVLEDITTIEEEFHYAKKDTCTVWKHCEPIKPDDSTIYKGGDNE